MSEVHHRMQVPAIVMVISAAMQSMFVFGALAWYGLSLFSTLVQAFTSDVPMEMLGFTVGITVWQGLTRLPQLVLALSGAVTARGAFVAWQGGPRRALLFGSWASLIGPLIALVGSFCLWLSFDCIGFVVGGLGRVVLVILGVVAVATTHAALEDEEVAARYPNTAREWH